MPRQVILASRPSGWPANAGKMLVRLCCVLPWGYDSL